MVQTVAQQDSTVDKKEELKLVFVHVIQQLQKIYPKDKQFELKNVRIRDFFNTCLEVKSIFVKEGDHRSVNLSIAEFDIDVKPVVPQLLRSKSNEGDLRVEITPTLLLRPANKKPMSIEKKIDFIYEFSKIGSKKSGVISFFTGAKFDANDIRLELANKILVFIQVELAKIREDAIVRYL